MKPTNHDERTWPSSRIVARRWAVNADGLEAVPAAEAAVAWRTPQSVGLAAGEWCSFGNEDDGPSDQGEDDARSLVFDSAPLDARLEILGAPVALLDVAVDQPRAFLAVRLNEVCPDGASRRVTYGLLNLTQECGPLVPGRRYSFGVVKNAQALGDFQVLRERGRRALRVHLGTDVKNGLARLRQAAS